MPKDKKQKRSHISKKRTIDDSASVQLSSPEKSRLLREKQTFRAFSGLGLSSQLSSVCAQVGWKAPSNVQEFCIPRLISPYSYYPQPAGQILSPFIFSIQAPPASGKTASYVLPILHHLMNSSTRDTCDRACSNQIKHAPKSFLHFLSSIIIAPTNELCLQIYNQLILFGEASKLRIGMIVGGGKSHASSRSNFLEQISMIHDRTVHIVLGTPGRIEYILLDSSAVPSAETLIVKNNTLVSDCQDSIIRSALQNVRFLVFDEADMLMSKKSMEQCVYRLINETIKYKRVSIIEQTRTQTDNVMSHEILPCLSVILVSATMNNKTVNGVWSTSLLCVNQDSTVNKASTNLSIDFQNPGSYDTLECKIPLPVTFAANDSNCIGKISPVSFNSLIEQQFLLCPAHVKIVHLYLLLSPSSEFCLLKQSKQHAECGLPGNPKMLLEPRQRKVIVFFNSKQECEITRITLQQLGLSVCALHSLQSPKQRCESLFSFQMQVYTILLTTDVCCRGLDIAYVDYILHYDIPRTIERYVHRIGRALRESNHQELASRIGQSILFITEKDQRSFCNFEGSISEIMNIGGNENSHDEWRLVRRKDIKEEKILKHLDVVLQSRLQAENAMSADCEKVRMAPLA